MRFVGIILAMAMSWSPVALAATYQDLIGFTRLESELGTTVPTGAGVHVTLVEARLDDKPPLDDSPDYIPEANAEFAGKTITARSPDGAISGHATIVGRNFFGNVTSTAPGVTTIDAFWSDHWLSNGYLQRSTTSPPNQSTSRVFNHSWVGPTASANLNILKRIDYVVETYDQIQVVGVNNDDDLNDGVNPSRPLLATAYNVIAAGVTDGTHATGTVAVGDLYAAGRTRPHLVTPATTTSNATAHISAAATLMVATAHDHPELSAGSYTVPTGPGRMYTVFHGETSEVVKAVLMAGAQRTDITSYNATTANGLDARYGAGELDIYNSYHIVAAGEQGSRERAGPAAPEFIGRRGFDYEPALADGEAASYHFVPDVNSTMLSATLAWNIDIAGGSPWDNDTNLTNLDLLLYAAGEQGNLLVGSSESSNENTENLWITGLTPGTEYLLQVVREDGTAPWDYGLAWQIAHDPAAPLFGDFNGDATVNPLDVPPLLLALTNRPSFDALYPGIDVDVIGDINRDGLLNNLDIDAMNVLIGGGPPLVTGQGIAPNAVPEPSALLLVLLAAAGLLAWWRLRANK